MQGRRRERVWRPGRSQETRRNSALSLRTSAMGSAMTTSGQQLRSLSPSKLALPAAQRPRRAASEQTPRPVAPGPFPEGLLSKHGAPLVGCLTITAPDGTPAPAHPLPALPPSLPGPSEPIARWEHTALLQSKEAVRISHGESSGHALFHTEQQHPRAPGARLVVSYCLC